MVTTGSNPEKNSLEVELHASRRGRKEHLKRCFLILKSLDSGNLWRRLKESMEALSSCYSLEHIPLKGKIDKSRRRSSERMLSKGNSLNNGLLSLFIGKS